MNKKQLIKYLYCFGEENARQDERFSFGAYPQWSVTKENAKYFAGFFRQKSVGFLVGAF